MKNDRLTKVLLGIIAVLLFVNLANSFFGSKPASAASGSEDKGKYQIAAWAVQAENAAPYTGYYVLDTTTGMVVSSKSEIRR